MTRPLQIAVIGAGAATPEVDRQAEELGRLLAEAGARVVCGGLGHVMEAASRGAAAAGGEVIGIVPTESPDDANPHVTHPVATGIGHARNLAVVASADAVVAVGGEWGTLSEIAFARRLGRPVVALGSWQLAREAAADWVSGIENAADPASAARTAIATAREVRNDV